MVESLSSKMNFLPDPCDDRSVKTLEPPPNKPLKQAHLFPYSGKCLFAGNLHHQMKEIAFMNTGADANKPDWKLVKAFLLKEGALAKEHVVAICRTSIEIMSNTSF